MSGVNGDKSRFNRVRRQKLARRIRNRELLKSAGSQGKPATSSSAEEAGGSINPPLPGLLF